MTFLSSSPDCVAFIPARGGSKSIPLKNIKVLGGKPLLCWTIEAALACDFIETVFVSTDSPQIERVVSDLRSPRARAIPRSPETASDTASSELALLEFCENHSFRHVFFIQATSPLLQSEHLQRAWDFLQQGTFDSLLSVVRVHQFHWAVDANGLAHPMNYDPRTRPRRQDHSGHLVENGAFYVSSREAILSSRCRLSGSIGVVELPRDTLVEIDEPIDWVVVEGIIRARKHSSERRDPTLSDIRLLAMDVDGVLTDAGMYYSESGDELKKFNTRDGMGLEILRNLGIQTAIITSEMTDLVARRAHKLRVDHVFQGVIDKRAVVLQLSSSLGIPLEQIAYVGDDLNDLSVFDLPVISFCPADAVSAVIKCARRVLSSRGGEGAVREVCEQIAASR